MHICIFNFYQTFNTRNIIFNPEANALVEGAEKPFVALKKKMNAMGHILSTIDQYPLESYEKFIFLDFPSNNPEILLELNAAGKDMYLILFESEIIKPDNWDVSNYRFFKKIFGWKPIYNANYARLMVPQNIDVCKSTIPFYNRKLACLVAGNKFNVDARELYSERRKIIRWFETNAANDFSLYGKGWEKGEKIWDNRLVRKISMLQKLCTKSYPSYCGEIGKKRSTLGGYKFNFCFENATGIKGYITEKIFDALLSGTVPIYWGAPDIFEFIPREAIIHFPDFQNIKELYLYISTMGESEWNKYLKAALDFVGSSNIVPFSPEYFADKIIEGIF
jgi:alpha(1,3/1,4) fucosyltransferase